MNASQWIPVSEWLPDGLSSIITCEETKIGLQLLNGAAWFKDGNFWCFDDYGIPEKILGVTHWMSLPDPPTK